MVARFHYDEVIYQRLLDDRIPSRELARITAHIERCSDCQSKLESVSQEGMSWNDVRRLLQPETSESTDCSRSTIGQAEHGQPSENDRAIGFLSPSDRPGSLGRFGRFEIQEVLGRGGMGIVLKGYDPALNRHSAIKVLAPELATSASARSRFSREARSMAAVVHEHVVPIQTVDEEQGLPYLVMPVVEGESLEQRVEQQGPLSVTEILRIGMQIASGLAAAHAQGLVHRDVKPANILLENGVERVMITDFGLARAADDANMTQSGVIAGTPQYMSPEQARGGDVDHRSDLFSLGSVLYYMCAGRSPFRAETTMGVLNRISNDKPRSLRRINSDVPAWLQDIIQGLLAKAPDQRFESAEEVADLLGRWLAHVSQPDAMPRPARSDRLQSSMSWGRGRSPIGRLLLAAAAGLFLMAGSVIVLELNKGTLRIECARPDVEVRIMKGDKVYREMMVTQRANSVRIAAGEYVVEIDGESDGLVVKNGSVTLNRGGDWVVKILESRPRIAGMEGQKKQRPRPMPASIRQDTITPVFLTTLPDHLNVVAVAQATLPDHLNVVAVAFTNDGDTLVSVATEDKVTIRTWDVNRELKKTVWLETELHGNQFAMGIGTTLSANGKTIAGIVQGKVNVWDAETGRLVKTLESPKDVYPRVLAVSPDGSLVAATTGGEAGGSNDVPAAIDHLPPDKAGKAADGGYNGGMAGFGPISVIVWNVKSGEPAQRFTHEDAHQINCLAFSSDARMLASGSQENGTVVWNVKSGWVSSLVSELPNRPVASIQSLAFSPDSQLLAIGETSGVTLWTLQNGRLIVRSEFDSVDSALLYSSPDGHPLDLRESDGGKLLSIQNLHNSRFIEAPYRSGRAALLFSPDGHRLARAGADDEILLWDTAFGSLVGEIECKSSLCAAFSPDGRFLAAGFSDRRQALKIWQLLDVVVKSPEDDTPSDRKSDLDGKAASEAVSGSTPTTIPRTVASANSDDSAKPLTVAIRQFNERHANHPIGKTQAPLTDDEVVASIRWAVMEKKAVPASDDEFDAFRDIAENRLVPPNWEFEILTGFEPNESERFVAWSIRLTLTRSNGTGYTHAIRKRLIRCQAADEAEPDLSIKVDDELGMITLRGADKEVKKVTELLQQSDVEVESPDDPLGQGTSGTPLAAAIHGFNVRYHRDPIGKDQPPLTEDEVIAAIRWWKHKRNEMNVTNHEFAALQQIADRRLLPVDAEFEIVGRFQPGDGFEYDKWSVRIRMPRTATPRAHYACSVRERFIRSRRIEDIGISWGQTAANGLQVGVRFEPRNERREQFVPYFIYRNTGKQVLDLAFPRLMTKDHYKAIHVTDETGKAVPITQGDRPSGPVGGTQFALDPDARYEIRGLPIAIGDGPYDDQVETIILAKPGQLFRVLFSLPNFADPEAGTLQTGELKFSRALPYGALSP